MHFRSADRGLVPWLIASVAVVALSWSPAQAQFRFWHPRPDNCPIPSTEPPAITDSKDTRESPSLEVFGILRRRGLDVSLFDPLLPEYACDSVLSVARGSDALAILVPHDLIVTEIRYRKPEILAGMRRPNILAFSPGVI